MPDCDCCCNNPAAEIKGIDCRRASAGKHIVIPCSMDWACCGCEGDGEGAPDSRGSTMEFCRLRMPTASRARSTDAWEVLPAGAATWLVALRVLKLEEERCRREGVGCVDGVSEFEGVSAGSSMMALVEELLEVLEATDTVCARREESSRVRILTWLYYVR